MSIRPASRLGAFLRRAGYALNLALFLGALVVIAIVVNVFAERPVLRMTIDATKTRAYSLSEQTQELLATLTGSWTIALVLVEDTADPATRQQIDEVLARYREAAEGISIVRVDPTDPTTIGAYEALLARLRAIEGDRIVAYELAIDEGVRAFAELQAFAQQQMGGLEAAFRAMPADDPVRDELQQRLGLLGLLADEGGKLLDLVASARAVTEAQPIPDYDVARSTLAEALARWADELYEMARTYRSWRELDGIEPEVLRYAAQVVGAYEAIAQHLAAVADPLAQLPPLEIASIGRQLRGGEALVLVGPDKAAVIPSGQLFPNVSTSLDNGLVAFDRRFRGEQVISAAIRSLLVDHMPTVVFMHAEEHSLLREHPQHADVVGVAGMLAASRIGVREWRVGRSDKPLVADGPVVWVVVPPARRKGIETSADEIGLIRATETLIDDGEAVLLSVNPSILPGYRQTDPWVALSQPFGLRADTSQAIFEAVPGAEGELVYQPYQTIERFEPGLPIGRALDGLRLYMGLPVPIRAAEDAPTGVTRETFSVVEPSPRRWLETSWAAKARSRGPVMRGEAIEAPVAIAVGADRADPVGSGRQRFLLIGSGGWMLSYVADVYDAMGGDRVVLRYPGNAELMLAAVAWLAGMDELIAPSPLGQQAARLDGIDDRTRVTWSLVTVVGLPVACLLVGAMVWMVRRV